MVEEKRLRFLFIAPLVNEEFFNPVKKGMRDAARMLDVDCAFTGTEHVDVAAQAQMIRRAVAEGYDGLAVSLIHPDAFNGALDEAAEQGVPIVAFNVDSPNPGTRHLSAVCQDGYRAGQTLGRAAIELSPARARVLLTLHNEGISILDERMRGVQDALREKGMTWTRLLTGMEEARAVEAIEGALAQEPQVRVVVATGQADLEFAAKVLEKRPREQGYAAAGFDLSSNILRLIKSGLIRCTIDQQPYVQGFYPVVQLAHYCRYGIRPANIDAGAGLVTPENVESAIELIQQGYR